VAEYVRLLTRHLSGSGHEVVVAGPPGSVLERDATAAGHEFVPIRSFRRLVDPRSDASALFALARVFASRPWDVIHLHSSKAGFLGRLAALLTARGAVVLYTPHCFAFLADLEQRLGSRRVGSRRLFWAAERLCRSLGDGVILVSRWEYVEADHARLLDSRRAWVIPNGAELARRAPIDEAEGDAYSAVEVRRRTGLPVVGTVTRLQRQKGVEDFLAMAAKVSESMDARFVVVGEGPDRESLEVLAATLGIADRCTFSGYSADVARELDTFDVFVLSSRWESMPLALIEAMEARLPIVATRVGGVPEMVRDEESGLLVDSGDPSAMASAVSRILRDPGLATRLSGAAGARYRDRFTPAGFCAATESLYVNLRCRRP
jgi:glycosyltransferase involved in cell wall biosynthesis